MSFINSVAKSMNGIKTIETSELIFTDDNSTLNTSAGITQAQTTGQTAINKSISAIGFNTGTGDLTLTTQGTGVNDLSVDLDGRYLTSIPSLDANDIPNLPASKINSGSFAVAQIPNLSASKIASDTFAVARIPSLPYVSVGTAQAHTDETIFGVKTFDEFPIKSGTGTALDPTADNQFATKQYVDDNGGGGTNAVFKNGGTTANPQILSGVNRITVESTPANTGNSINQFYGDANYGDKLDFGFVQTNDPVATADIPNITRGQPSASNPDQYGGALFELSVDITPIKTGAKVLCNYSIVGEWEQGSWDNMTYIAVATKNNDGTYTYNRVLRAIGGGNRSAGISGFNIKFHIDNQSTMEQSTGQFIDQSSSLNANQTYRFTPVIVNTGENTPKKFYMNRTKIDTNSFAYERGCSSFVVQILGYS